MLFSDLSKKISGALHLSEDVEVKYFSQDTRNLQGREDEVFIAIKANRQGHDFIGEAVSKGVRNFIVEKQTPLLASCNYLVVENTLVSFQKIAALHRAQFDVPVIGITGSNGKTTVKEWLATLLSEKYFVAKNPKSYNSQIGVPLSVLTLAPPHEIAVFEAGISTAGEMQKLQTMIQPTLGIFTTLGEAHNEGFTSKEEKLKEKLALFDTAEQLIFRSDVPYAEAINDHIKAKPITWALDASGQIKVKWYDGVIDVEGAAFETHFSNPTELENATHAIIAARLCKVDDAAIQRGLHLLSSLPMRLAIKKGIQNCTLLDDSYSNDLAGLKVALEYMDSHHALPSKTLILSDILQSGYAHDALYKAVNALISQHQITRLIGVGSDIKAAAPFFDVATVFFETTQELMAHLPHFESEMILIKGARHFGLEKVVKVLEEKLHGTVLEVNFEALQHNLHQYRALLQPSTKMMVMVKANAYGSGLLEVAHFLQHQRVDQLGVAYVDEAIILRKNGITLPIMIMNPFIDSFSAFEKHHLQAEIFNLAHLHRLLQDTTAEMTIQIKIDTGMHRLGFKPDELGDLVALLKDHPRIKVGGIFTHFSSADDPKEDAFTIAQADAFEKAYLQLTSALGYHPSRHACNSSAIIRWPAYHYDMVRLGIGLHGFDPSKKLRLRTVAKLKALISQIQPVEKGQAVGYGRAQVLARDSKIAIIPIGYEDGYSRAFGKGIGKVRVGSHLCPVIGNVCMDMIMVDVTDTPAREGDEVMLFADHPTIEDLARWAHTIPYEILTNVSSRVKRVFVWE